jgi:hypothetical protein
MIAMYTKLLLVVTIALFCILTRSQSINTLWLRRVLNSPDLGGVYDGLYRTTHSLTHPLTRSLAHIHSL